MATTVPRGPPSRDRTGRNRAPAYAYRLSSTPTHTRPWRSWKMEVTFVPGRPRRGSTADRLVPRRTSTAPRFPIQTLPSAIAATELTLSDDRPSRVEKVVTL